MLCGLVLGVKDKSREHILPRGLGGRGDVYNLAITHKRCNNQRGCQDLTLEQRRRVVELRGALSAYRLVFVALLLAATT